MQFVPRLEPEISRTSADNLVRYLEWDPDHFGKRIATVVNPFLDPITNALEFQWCEERKLEMIARQSHRVSRFYAEGNFPIAQCDALYEPWIRKSCNGYADAVFVAESRGYAAGYISCHLRGNADGQIGLFAVSQGFQGTGLGRQLNLRALDWFTERESGDRQRQRGVS